MGDYAPKAILRLSKLCDGLPGCTPSGVLGDKRHHYGYHRGRNQLPATDYSRQLAEDKSGPSGAASAIDLTFTAKQMKVMTARLKKSALDPNDPRLNAVREFYGTLNGKTVYGLINSGSGEAWRSSTADSSHLWHIHISFFRMFAENFDAIKGVYDVLAGLPYRKPTPPPVKKPDKQTPVKEVAPVTNIFTQILPYLSSAGKRIKAKGWAEVSPKTQLDYIWEGVMNLGASIDGVHAALDLDDKLRTKALSPAEKAEILKQYLGDDSVAVGNILGGK